MDEQLTKSLTDLIDETLSELEELRKSKMSAAEIKIEGPGEGIAGKPSDGKLDAKKADEDEDEEDEGEDEEAEEAAKSDPDDEGHDTDDPADKPSAGRKLKAIMESKKSEDGDDEEDEEVEKSWKMSKKDKKEDKDEPHKDDPKHEEKEKKIAKKLLDMHKSSEEVSSLMKSYVEDRIQPLEQKLETIFELVNSIAKQPVAPRGFTVKSAPLLKSADAEYGETLSKAQVANKLFELKKSGTRVDSLDIAKAEMGQDLVNIVKKYELS